MPIKEETENRTLTDQIPINKGSSDRKTLNKMIGNSLKILLFLSLIFISACNKGEDSPILDLTNDTDKAVKLIDSANADLKEIKKLYKLNENRVEDLKIAMRDKKVEEAKKIANDAVYAINDGMALGEKAVAKIEEAKNLDINDDFREYLDLKETSIRKFMEAFGFRREIALALRNGYDPENAKQREIVLAEFKEKEQKFKQLEEEAQDLSRKANKLAKQAAQGSDDDS